MISGQLCRCIVYASVTAPPAMLQYQKARGMTLRPSCSLFSHWMMKRQANRPWPRKPMASQPLSPPIQSSQWPITSPFLRNIGSSEAALQPHHAHQVRKADQRTVPNTVFRAARSSRTVTHRHEAHFMAFTQHQRDEVAVHVIEIGQLQKCLAAENFQSAARIFGVVGQKPAPHAIAVARGHTLLPIVLTPCPLARQHDNLWLVTGSAESSQQFGNICWVVLAVTVKCHDQRRFCGPDARPERPALAEVAAVRNDPHRHFLTQAEKLADRAVR